MPAMTEPRELFLHELGDILYAENVQVKALPKLAREAKDEALRDGFQEHLQETKEQIKNIKEVFKGIGEKASAEKCPGIDGINSEHDMFMSEHDASPEICDLFLAGAGARAEHYEIAAYSGLVAMARAMGEKDAASLLEENLRQEKATLRKLETATRRLAKSAKTANGGTSSKKSSKR